MIGVASPTSSGKTRLDLCVGTLKSHSNFIASGPGRGLPARVGCEVGGADQGAVRLIKINDPTIQMGPP